MASCSKKKHSLVNRSISKTPYEGLESFFGPHSITLHKTKRSHSYHQPVRTYWRNDNYKWENEVHVRDKCKKQLGNRQLGRRTECRRRNSPRIRKQEAEATTQLSKQHSMSYRRASLQQRLIDAVTKSHDSETGALVRDILRNRVRMKEFHRKKHSERLSKGDENVLTPSYYCKKQADNLQHDESMPSTKKTLSPDSERLIQDFVQRRHANFSCPRDLRKAFFKPNKTAIQTAEKLIIEYDETSYKPNYRAERVRHKSVNLAGQETGDSLADDICINDSLSYYKPSISQEDSRSYNRNIARAPSLTNIQKGEETYELVTMTTPDTAAGLAEDSQSIMIAVGLQNCNALQQHLSSRLGLRKDP